LPDWEVIGVSRRPPPGSARASFVSVDLTDHRQCAEVFSRLTEVTHLVYAAVNEQPGLEAGWKDGAQMRLNLSMLENLFAPLAAAASGLPHVSLLQGTKAYGAHLGRIAVPARERAPAIRTRISTGSKKIISGRNNTGSRGSGRSGARTSSSARRLAAI
jgi:hypothetical protein